MQIERRPVIEAAVDALEGKRGLKVVQKSSYLSLSLCAAANEVQSIVGMSENYALLSGQPKSGSAFFKVIGVGSLLMLVVAVVLGVAITTQVFRINKSGLSTAAHAQWKVRSRILGQ